MKQLLMIKRAIYVPQDIPSAIQSQLASVPMLLAMLVEQGVISSASQEKVVNALRVKPEAGKARFAGDLLVEMGILNEKTGEPVTSAIVKDCLRQQSMKKIDAALKDMQQIVAGEKLEVPAWLKPNWGNNGLNAPASDITKEDGLSAAANMAQNLVLLVNRQPAVAKDAQTIVLALANLARGIEQGDSPRVPVLKKGEEWLSEAKKFEALVTKTGAALSDNAGNAVDVKQFAQARFKEVTSALELTLGSQKQEPSMVR